MNSLEETLSDFEKVMIFLNDHKFKHKFALVNKEDKSILLLSSIFTKKKGEEYQITKIKSADHNHQTNFTKIQRQKLIAGCKKSLQRLVRKDRKNYQHRDKTTNYELSTSNT